MYYRVCPICGCSLDPGDRCDCERDENMDGMDDYAMRARPVRRRTDAEDFGVVPDAYVQRRGVVMEA